ncbi:hypothetical protein Pan44_27080 [Caulifigura coniformis]|uniref:Uncharacterized protein n=1 Tax=Caulifigura coniformis TaxID=2527983 RepID=A0A517SEW8_9PLAN|nr:hypothetical protein [Caulifigura coniformis]QDT54673.1 hypothetical protein Pan44_27080 [Caulifigura coniformis]
MSTRFEVQGDVAQAKQALGEVATEVKKVGTAADQAGAEMDAAFDSASDVQKFTDEVGDLTTALKQAETQAEQTNAEIGNPGAGKAGGDGLEKWTALFTGVTAGVTIVKGLADGFRAVREQIKQMADNGNAQMGELNSQLDRMSDSLFDMADNLSSSKEGSGVLGFLGDLATFAGDAARHIDTLDETMAGTAAGWASNAASMVGWTSAADALTAAQERMNAAAQKSEDNEFAERQSRQLEQVNQVFEDLEAKRAAQRKADEIEQIDSLDAVQEKMDEQRRSLEALAKSTNLTRKDQVDAARNLEALERRRLQILKNNAAAEEKAKDEATQRAKDEADAKKQQYDREEADKTKLEAAKTATEKAEAAERQAIADAEAAAKQKAIDALAGDQGVKDLSSQIRQAAQDPRAIRDRLAQNAKDAATDAAYQNDGEIDSRERREIEEARRAAYRKATAQMNGGPQSFKPEQVNEAIALNQNAQINAMQTQAGLSDQMVAALGQNANVMATFEQEQARHSQEIDHLMKFVQSMSQNTTRRAQSMGRKNM